MAESHLRLLREMLELLERYATTITRADLEHDRETWLKVRGALEVASQCCIDLALAIISQRALDLPQSYREAFVVLARHGIIDRELAAELEPWAGFRNVLVHLYTALDLDIIVRALSQTAPLRAFAEVAAAEIAACPDR